MLAQTPYSRVFQVFDGSFDSPYAVAGWFNGRRFVAESSPRMPTTDPGDTRRRAKMLLAVNQISELTGRDRHGTPKRLKICRLRLAIKTNGSMPIFCRYTAWLQSGADSTLGLCYSPSVN